METISSAAGALAEPHPALTVSAIGFTHRHGARDRDNDLCAALLAIAGHDLRQPLQVIIGAHDILAKTLNGSAEQIQLARLDGAASKLSDKLDQLIEALRLFEASSENGQEAVQLGPIFRISEAEFAEPARLKGITLRVIPTQAVVSSNPVLLHGILRNLIRNAIDYTPRGGGVLVAARRRGAAVHLEVRDSGIGVPAAELAHVFRPFYRVDTTRVDSFGLGLFIVKRAAAFLGHAVELYSAVGRGSRFVVVAETAPNPNRIGDLK